MALFTIVWSSSSGLLSGTLGGLLLELTGRQTFYLTAMSFALASLIGFGFQLLRTTAHRSI